MSSQRRALALLLASLLLASPAAANQIEEVYGGAAVEVPAAAHVPAESGVYPATRTLERIREWRPTRAYREERDYRAIERFGAAGPYPMRSLGPAEETGRKTLTEIQSPETRYGPDLRRAKDTGQVSLRLSRAVWGGNGTPNETGGGWRVTNAPSAHRPRTTGIVRRGVQR